MELHLNLSYEGSGHHKLFLPVVCLSNIESKIYRKQLDFRKSRFCYVLPITSCFTFKRSILVIECGV